MTPAELTGLARSLDEHVGRTTALKLQNAADAWANDRSEVKLLKRIIGNLKRGTCWCEVAVGNPMVRGEHSPACKAATVAMGLPLDHFVVPGGKP